MKVLQVNTVCGFGSTGRIVVELANMVNSRGDKCRIAYGRATDNPMYDDAYYIGSEIDHRVHGGLSRITDRQGFYSKAATQRFIKQVIEYNPDIIHLHNVHGYYLNIPILFEFLADFDKPVVWTLHDCWAFTGHCSYFDIAACEKWKSICDCCPQKKEYPSSYFLDSSKKNFLDKKHYFLLPKKTHIVTPSSWLQGLLKESFLAGVDSCVINNGINLNNFKRDEGKVRKKHNLENKTILLGVASIWGERKGFSDFIKLANEVTENTVIILVGVTQKQKEQLPKSVIGIERTNNIEELCQYYSDADYFLNLTYQDNFPTANIEALACGTPVITYKTGGSVEIADYTCGRVVNKGDIQEILSIISNSKFDHDACIKRAKKYDAASRYMDYYDLYKKLSINRC